MQHFSALACKYYHHQYSHLSASEVYKPALLDEKRLGMELVP